MLLMELHNKTKQIIESLRFGIIVYVKIFFFTLFIIPAFFQDFLGAISPENWHACRSSDIVRHLGNDFNSQKVLLGKREITTFRFSVCCGQRDRTVIYSLQNRMQLFMRLSSLNYGPKRNFNTARTRYVLRRLGIPNLPRTRYVPRQSRG